MKNELKPSIREGLYSHLYDHFLVRSPHHAISVLCRSEALRTIDATEGERVSSLLQTQGWEVGFHRPDMAPIVVKHWPEISPRMRGDYLSGSSESVRLKDHSSGDMLQFILEKLEGGGEVEFSAVSACQLGCNLLAFGQETAFARLLEYDVDWQQAIERIQPADAKRWKTPHLLSKRVIDVFLEATLILKRPDSTQLVLERGANPNILVWQLERSSNARYTALSYAIHHEQERASAALLRFNADAKGSNQVAMRCPLSEAFLRGDRRLIEKLLDAGASLNDGATFSKVPFPYGLSCPVEWVQENLADLIDFIPLEAKPLFHSPDAQGGWYYSLLEIAAGDLQLLRFVADQGLNLQLTAYEAASLINLNRHEALSFILDRIAPEQKETVLARVHSERPEFYFEVESLGRRVSQRGE